MAEYRDKLIEEYINKPFAVKPMSQEHLDYAQKINNKISS